MPASNVVVERSAARAAIGRFAGGSTAPRSDILRGEVSVMRLADLVERLPETARLPGAVLSVQGATSAIFALAASGWPAGGWGAVAALPDAGLLAAAEWGVPIDRLVCIPDLGPHPARVAGVLVDGFDVVALGAQRLTTRQQRQLTARVRQRGSRLLVATPWEGADLTIEIDSIHWEGLGQGHGLLNEAQLAVRWRERRVAPWVRERGGDVSSSAS